MRALIIGLIALVGACASAPNAEEAPIVSRVDHIIYGVADLDAGIAEIEALLGVRAAYGGAHPGRGTHNALLSLGPTAYLEIIARDPNQPEPQYPRPLGLDTLQESKLIGWAGNAPSVEAIVEQANAAGFPMFDPAPGQRRTPDGSLLTWRGASLREFTRGDGVIPFFIDWTGSTSPASSAPQGARLVSLRVQHPDQAGLQPIVNAFGLPIEIEQGAAPTLIAVIDGPRGRVELR